MYFTFKSTTVLFFSLALLHITKAQDKDINFKSVLQAIPSIDSTYNVVRSQIYPNSNDDKFKPIVPSDFYVQKALKSRDTPKIQTVNIQQQIIPKLPTAVKINQQHKTKKTQIQASALSENNKQKIMWAITPLNPLSSFVVENGLQHDIVQATPLRTQSPPTPQPNQEGVYTAQLTPVNPEEATMNPQNQQIKNNPSKQSKPSTTNIRQQYALNSNKQTKTTYAKAEQHRSNLTFIIIGVLILVVVYVIVKSQRKTKVSSLSILHSRLENYKMEQDDEDQYSFSKSKTSLQQDDGSDDQNQSEGIQIYKNKNNRVT